MRRRAVVLTVRSAPRLSIIIPTLNEGGIIEHLLESLQPVRRLGHELILVDGGSADDILARASPRVDQALASGPGRARQMNLGAGRASGELLWFVHADSAIPGDAAALIQRACSDRLWGRFDVSLSGRGIRFRVIGALMNLRSRLSGIATGDQGIFVRHAVFEQVGGFPEIPLMEDIALSRRLRSRGRPACLRQRITTSSRRWERNGVWRTVWLMWRLRLRYALGADPAGLAETYRQCSSPTQPS